MLEKGGDDGDEGLALTGFDVAHLIPFRNGPEWVSLRRQFHRPSFPVSDEEAVDRDASRFAGLGETSDIFHCLRRS